MTAPVYDYVIVGAGSAGCVLAERLSANPRVSVLLLESGPPDNHPFITMPMGIGRLGATPDDPHYWRFRVSQGPGRADEDWVKGRTLGGSSSINGMVYIRGMPDDYDQWETDGADGWGWATMSRCFKAIEDHELGAAETRGAGGPCRITLNQKAGPLAGAVLEAAAQAGVPIHEDINDPAFAKTGCFGPQPRTISRGRRMSAARAFLRPALGRRNLTVLTNAEATKIDFENDRASGVQFQCGDERRKVSATRGVILSAGAINSPKLLQLSGIGPADALRAAGIPVRIDSPGVGRNLREHRTVSHTFRLRHGGYNASLRPNAVYATALQYYLFRNGPLAQATFIVSGMVKTMPHLDRPDGLIGVSLFSFDSDGVSVKPGMTMFGFVMRSDSLGELSVASPDPHAPPRINANYLATAHDRQHTVSLMRMMRRIASQPALAPFIEAETAPGLHVESDEDLIEYSFSHGTTGYHVAGTCRMGNDAQSVVDPHLRVRGVSGLRVVDTSVMPSISGNTNAPAMAIAWRAAELIAESNDYPA